MIARARSIWFAIRASYWFYPALFSFSAFVLAMTLVEVDRRGLADWLSSIEALHPARPDGASNMLTVLAGSMIGVASTVFSITIAAVAYASGTYGPRLLTNFMEDKGNQLSLATFIGTFVYAITVLRTVRSEDEASFFAVDDGSALPGFVPQLSLLVGFGLMIVSVAVLVYFLHHIPSSIRINTVLKGIGEDLLHKIRHRFEKDGEDAGDECPASPDGAPVKATSTGYIRLIEWSQLAETAQDKGIVIGMTVRVGDFVHPGKVIARVNRFSVEDDTCHAIRNCFALGGSRTPEQDIEFPIDELVEIALRALSPGINDPFTAITAIHWLGAATAELGQRKLVGLRSASVDNSEHIVPLPDDFRHFLHRGFGTARTSLASNRLTALVAFDTLQDGAFVIANKERRELLANEGKLIMEQAELALSGPELAEVRQRHADFARIMDS